MKLIKSREAKIPVIVNIKLNVTRPNQGTHTMDTLYSDYTENFD